MENGKGNGIFLGIVSVATLIVAIIGATFAYFSATTESNENAVGVTAYEFKLTLSVEPVYPTGAAALIPLNPETVIPNAPEPNNTNLLYALNGAKTKCVDDSGLQVCALYKVTIVNYGNQVILSGALKTTKNVASTQEGRTPFTNLTYQGLTGSHEDNTLATVGKAVTLAAAEGQEVAISDITIEGASVDDDGEVVPGEGIAYILVYLNDNGDQSSEMGASFTGQIIYRSKDGIGNNLTGTFTVSAPTEPDLEPEEPTDEPEEGQE